MKTVKRGSALLLTGLALAVVVTPAEAQRRYDGFDRREPRVFVGGGLTFADPVGDFALFVDDGWGFDAHLRMAADPLGLVSLRLNAGFIQYGRERQTVCLSITVGCRILTDLVTTNNIAYLDAGPEIGVNFGALRPYAGLSAGFAYFETSSSLTDFDDWNHDYDVFETTNFDDLVLAWRARTGVQLRVGGRGNPVFLDFATVWHNNGEAEYLTRGDIQDHPDGSITVFPTYSEANLVTYQVGVSVGLGGRGGGDDDDRRRRRRRR